MFRFCLEEDISETLNLWEEENPHFFWNLVLLNKKVEVFCVWTSHLLHLEKLVYEQVTWLHLEYFQV